MNPSPLILMPKELDYERLISLAEEYNRVVEEFNRAEIEYVRARQELAVQLSVMATFLCEHAGQK